MNPSDIAILSTVNNFELYKKSSSLYPPEISSYVIDGRNGMHGLHSILYMFHIFKNKNIQWLIMADEDVIFQDPDEVFNIIDHMERNNISVCGIRDGGVISHRNFNPNVINTFFSIINFKKISQLFHKQSFLKNKYTKTDEFSDKLNFLPFKYDETSLYEPYYCFYLWLR